MIGAQVRARIEQEKRGRELAEKFKNALLAKAIQMDNTAAVDEPEQVSNRLEDSQDRIITYRESSSIVISKSDMHQWNQEFSKFIEKERYEVALLQWLRYLKELRIIKEKDVKGKQYHYYLEIEIRDIIKKIYKLHEIRNPKRCCLCARKSLKGLSF